MATDTRIILKKLDDQQTVSDPLELLVIRYPLDENGIQIKPQDVLRVFHFTDRRNKKHYMYKQVKGVVGSGKYKYLVIDHLVGEGDYRQLMNGKKIKGYEVVQGLGLDERKPVTV